MFCRWARSASRLAHEFERRANLAGQVGRHGGAEDEGARAIDEKIFQRAAAADERARARESLSAGVNDGQDFALAIAARRRARVLAVRKRRLRALRR